jgi:RNA polymerase sigma factor (sigma-70 family)
MNANQTTRDQKPSAKRRNQEQRLQIMEAELRTLASEKKKEEFFKQILPILGPLNEYIKRRLRIAYYIGDVQTPFYTEGDMLDDVVLRAYEHYDKRPPGLSLEQWLYQLGNEYVDSYISRRKSLERGRRSLERLTDAELGSLDEFPVTADAEGEVTTMEDVDDISYQKRDFLAPGSRYTPEQALETKEEVLEILRTLRKLPVRDRVVFELHVGQGFSKEEVACIMGLTPAEVTRIVETIKGLVRYHLYCQGQEHRRRAA